MVTLKLIPSNANCDYSSGKCEHIATSSNKTSNEQSTQTQMHTSVVHQSWHGSHQRIASPPHPFVAAVEPTDTTSEERNQKIMCQKVVVLAAQLFPEARCSADLQVEHVGTGTFHDVIGFTNPTPKLTLKKSDNTTESGRFVIEHEKYVVRIPRSDVTDHSAAMRREIAVLRGLEGNLHVPIPRVIAFDVDKNNAIGSPYSLETRLRGRSLEDLVGNDTNEAQNVDVFEKTIRLVDSFAQVTAPYAGCIAEEFGKGFDAHLCTSRIPMKMLEFPFDVSTLTQLPNHNPLTFMLELVDLWVQYEHEYCSDENNTMLWYEIKGILHSLQRRGLIGETFHLSHGDVASRNILAEVVDDSSIEITGVVDWDFACFAPKFCAYQAPMEMWSGGEETAIEECTAELIEIFRKTASPEYIRFVFSLEARLGRKIWYTLCKGMMSENQRWFATSNISEWGRLHPEDKIG